MALIAIPSFGADLKGICASDDSVQALGIFQALEKAGRTDVVVAEGDGVLSAKYAADWFNGKKMPLCLNLVQHIITEADVDGFYPPQW